MYIKVTGIHRLTSSAYFSIDYTVYHHGKMTIKGTVTVQNSDTAKMIYQEIKRQIQPEYDRVSAEIEERNRLTRELNLLLDMDRLEGKI